MKVFLGFLLLASLTIAAVDEKEATPIVPESKKTDLLITANGQTIKVNADGKGGNPIGLAAHRFRLSHHRNARVQTRRMEGDEESGSYSGDYDSDSGYSGSAGGDNDGEHYGGPEEPDEVEEFEVRDIDKKIRFLKKKIEGVPEGDSVSFHREDIEDIISMLESFGQAIEEADEASSSHDEERRNRRRRSRVMKKNHSRSNRGFVRHHRTWARRQSVVHKAHFHGQKLGNSQRIVVNP